MEHTEEYKKSAIGDSFEANRTSVVIPASGVIDLSFVRDGVLDAHFKTDAESIKSAMAEYFERNTTGREVIYQPRILE